MAATVRETVRELMESAMETMEALLTLTGEDLAASSGHACAQGKDAWALITNDIDHEKIHAGQVLDARAESRLTASPASRLAAEWLAERARFIGTLLGLSDEEFNRETAPGAMTYRHVAKHVLLNERDSLRTLAGERAAREAFEEAQ